MIRMTPKVVVAAAAALAVGLVALLGVSSLWSPQTTVLDRLARSAFAQSPLPPVADAGPDIPFFVLYEFDSAGDVVLDGSGSTDPNGQGLTYSWTFLSIPEGAEEPAFDDATAVKPGFFAEFPGSGGEFGEFAATAGPDDYLVELTVTNGAGLSDSDTVIVSFDFVPPVADAGADRRAAPGDRIVLDGSRSGDPVRGRLSYAWSLVEVPAGSAAVLDDPTAIRPAFTVDLPGTYLAELVVRGDDLDSAPDQVVISTEGVAPQAGAGPELAAAAGDRIQLDASASTDADGDALDYRWTILAAPALSTAALSDPAAPRPGLTLDLPGDYVLQLSVTDATGKVSHDTVTLSTGKLRPLADAGPDRRIALGAPVTLDGAASSDANGDLLSYRWSLIRTPEGFQFGLSNESSLRSSFTPNAPGSYVAQLIVIDETELSRPVTLVLTTENGPPLADAGPDQTVAAGATVQLDGAASVDPDGDLLSYRWAILEAPGGGPAGSAALGAVSVAATTQDDDDDDDGDDDDGDDDDGGGGGPGPGAELSDPTAVAPSFVAGAEGLYVIQLIVDDGVTESVADTVAISTVNSRPVADAGPDQAPVQPLEVLLDGSGSSDADNDPLTFRWDLIAAPARSDAAISNPDAAAPSFLPDLAGTYVAQLIVDDGQLQSAPDSVVVTIENGRPVARFTAVSIVRPGGTVNLGGGPSFDPDRDPITYRWTLLGRPAGSTAVLSSLDGRNSSFVADLLGDYEVQLVVNDGQIDSLPFVRTIRANNRPLAVVGPDRPGFISEPLQLDGTGSSDPDGDPLSFAWSLLRPDGSTAVLSDSGSPTPSFVPDIEGFYRATLVVSDGFEESPAVSVDITVANRPPVAEAGPAQTVAVNTTVQLDGSGSSDPDNQPLSFAWQLETPPRSAAVLSDPTAASPSFVPDVAGFYAAVLRVSDGFVVSGSDNVLVTAERLGPGNVPPELAPVGNQSVTVGETLRLTLGASDANLDPLTFFALPSPLPAGMSLDTASGAFAFAPGPDQVGSLALTLGVSDGFASDSESVLFTVLGGAPGGATALTGLVLDAEGGAGAPTPVVGATVSLQGGTASGVTDGEGRFTLSGVPAGGQVLKVDGSTAAPAPDGSAYTSLIDDVELIAGVTNSLDGGVFLARIDPDSSGTVDPAVTITVSDDAFGATLRVIRDTAFNPDGTPYAGPLSLSPLSSELVASVLPAFVSPCNLVSIQPFGINFRTEFSRNARLELPNFDDLPRNTIVDVWALNAATGRFFVLQTATVTFGNKIVVPRIPFSGLYFALPRGPGASVTTDTNVDNVTPTALADGNLGESITLPSYRSLGQDRTRTFVYNSSAASPIPVFSADVTLPLVGSAGQSPRPAVLEARLELGGLATAPVFTSPNLPADPQDPGLAAGESFRQAIAFQGVDLPSGIHPYRLITAAEYGCSRRGTVTQGQVVIKNDEDSPYGAGWTLAEQQKVSKQGENLLLEEGDGSTLTFPPAVTEDSFLEPSFFPANAALTLAVDDLDGDGDLDLAVPDHVPGIVKILLGDGAGNLELVRELNTGQPTEVGTPPDTLAVATGDFDKDGIRDLAVANQLAQQVKVFEGTGNGAYQLQAELGISTKRPSDLGVADFDGDGNDDIVAISNPRILGDFAGRLTVFLGDGAGAFPTTREFGAADGSAALVVADFNGDEAPDVASVSYAAGRVSIFRNDGSGLFTRQNFNSGPVRALVGRRAIAAGDLNGDGLADLAVTNSARTLSILINDGSGAFPTRKVLPNGRSREAFEPKSVEIADINGDGALDLVASGQDAGSVSIHLGDGLGGFATPSVIPVGAPTANALRVADLDANGLPDILVGSDTDQVVYLLRGDPAAPATYLSPPGDFSVLVENQDGTFTRRLKDGTRYDFDSAGQMTAETDRNGNTTRYLYNPDGTLAKVIDPTNDAADPACGTPGVTCLDYVNGRLAVVTDPGNRTTRQEYDADGNLTKVTNPDGSTRTFAYDGNHRLITSTSERDFDTTHDYGAAGQWLGSGFPDGASIAADIAKNLGLANLGIGLGGRNNPAPYARPNETTTLTDAKGNPYTFKFNRFGSPVEITDPIKRTTVLERNDDDLLTAVVRPNDGELPDGSKPPTVRTELDYDSRGNVTAQREAVGTALQRANRFVYEPVFNNVTLIADPSNTSPNPQCGTAGVTCFTYDAQGNVERVTAFVDGGTIFPQTSTYDSRGLELTRRDAEDNLTQFVYTPLGDLEKVIDAEQNEILFQRDNLGRVEFRTEGLGSPAERTLGFTYDAMNRIETETDGEGGVTTRRYDPAGNETETEDATGIVVTREFDERNRLTMENDPVRGPVARTYDANGNLKTVVNALNSTVTLVYDSVNRVEKTTDPLDQERLFDYDALDNVRIVTDARSNTTTFVSDPLGRQVRRENPLSQTWRFSYDSRDNQIRSDDPKGQTIVREYDALSRLERVTLTEADGITVEDIITFTYDANGNRLTAKDGDSSLALTYDGLNRIETAGTLDEGSAVQPATVLTSVYDAVGNRVELRHGPNELITDGTWSYGYDDVGRLTALVHPTGDPLEPVAFSYDLAGRLATIDFPNSVNTDVGYDPRGRIQSISHNRVQNELASFTYTTFEDGLISSIIEPAGTRNFTYDELQQLTSGGFASAPESYGYDEEGNRSTSHLSSSYDTDSGNRLREDETFCYDYDANGNLEVKTRKISGACAGEATRFTWDVWNRLIRIDLPNAQYVAYRYDAAWRRIEKDVNGEITRYVYDEEDILLQYDAADARIARYGHGDNVDQPLVVERESETLFHHADHLGSIRLLSTSLGQVADVRDYDAFGGIATAGVSDAASLFAFTGREYDPESALYYYRARYYDPVLGRFIQEDPIGFDAEDLNLYRFVFNDPLNKKDPFGLSPASSEGAVACFSAAFAAEAGLVIGQLTGQLLGFVLASLDKVRTVYDSELTYTEAFFEGAAVVGSGVTGCLIGTGAIQKTFRISILGKGRVKRFVDQILTVQEQRGISAFLTGLLSGLGSAELFPWGSRRDE